MIANGMQDNDIVFFAYVSHLDVPRYLDAGWIVCQIVKPFHHDVRGFIMEWDQLGEPPDMGERQSMPDVAGNGLDCERDD